VVHVYQDVQDWASSDKSSLKRTPILPARHEREHDRSQDVCETGIERPHDASASRKLLLAVISGSSSVDLSGESVERSLKGGGILTTLS
jgi:hypothetical protein